ncbi:cytochrome c oxidase subunit II [Sphingomonas sp. RT2P30]
MTGLRTFALAIGLAVASIGQAASAQPAAPAATAAPAPVVATAPAAAAATDPMLAMDGAPAMLPKAGIGQPIDGSYQLQQQFTPTGRSALKFHDYILFPVITVITLFVLLLLIIVVARFRRAANPVPTKTAHNTALEIAWTLIPVLILAGIAAPSIGLLQAQYKAPPANAVTLKAIGNQWYWSYEYPGNGGIQLTSNMLKEHDQVAAGERARTEADGPRLLATDQRVVLPVGVPIRLITTAKDVIHSWSIPAFWVKLDAIPGRLNETSFTIEKEGVYFGVCSELCGARHGFMPITVEAVKPEVFAAWVKAKGGTMPGAAPAAVTANASAPVDNATAAAPETNQTATANSAAAGNTGQ